MGNWTTEGVYAVAGSVFLVFLTLAVITTGARLLWYLRYRQPLPKLLPRDVVTKGGTWLTFAPIAILRMVLPPEQRTAFT